MRLGGSDRVAHPGVLTLAAVAWLVVPAPTARAQAVGFQPVVSAFPSGVTLPVTPVVSYDRRYVRLGLAPQFTSLDGLDPFMVPAAVSGGGVAGAGGGLGLGVGGAGGGNRLAAGMNGVMEPGDVAVAELPRAFGPGFASPEAVAVLGGQGGPVASPRLSDGLPPEDAAPRVKARGPRATHKSVRPKRR